MGAHFSWVGRISVNGQSGEGSLRLKIVGSVFVVGMCWLLFRRSKENICPRGKVKL